MNGPKKFKEAAEGDLGATLLRAARHEQHDERALQRTLLALTAASAATLGGAGIAKAASAGVSGAVKSAQVAVAPSASAAVTGFAKSAALVTVAKWFGVTAIAGGAVLGSARWWEAAQPAAIAVSATQPGAGKVNDPQVSDATPLAAPESAAAPAPLAVRAPLPIAGNAPRAALPSALTRPSPELDPVGPRRGAHLEQSRGEQPVPAPVEPASALAQMDHGSAPTPQAPTLQAPRSDTLAPAAQDPGPRQGASARTSSLAAEVRSLDAARAGLSAGDPRGALRLLVQHRQRFGMGSFGPEALFLQMQAEKALGDGLAARRTARQILEQFPSGPSVDSARQLLGQ